MSQSITFFQGQKINFPPSTSTIGALYHCLDTHETYLCTAENTFELYSSVLPEEIIINDVRLKLQEWQTSGSWDGETLTWLINGDELVITSSIGTSAANLKGINAVYTGITEPTQGEEGWINPDVTAWGFQMGDKGDKGLDYVLTRNDKILIAKAVIEKLSKEVNQE